LRAKESPLMTPGKRGGVSTVARQKVGEKRGKTGYPQEFQIVVRRAMKREVGHSLKRKRRKGKGL